MKARLSLPILAAVAVCTAACFPTEDSSNIKTGGIYVEYEVLETGSSAKAQAVFWTGDRPGGTDLQLTGGDTIEVNGVKLDKTGSSPVTYSARIDTAEEYDFVFERVDEDPYSSIVNNLPEPATITAPDGEDYARDEEVVITWDISDAGDSLNLLINGDCLWDYPSTNGEDVSDNGEHTVPAGEENGLDVMEGDEDVTCTANIELTREVNGDLSADLKGTIVGKVRSKASFESTPAAEFL